MSWKKIAVLARSTNLSISKYGRTSFVQPDVLIVCRPIEKAFLDFNPELVVEVLSPSTKLKDINIKYELYEEAGVKYYLIINPEDKSVKAYRLGQTGYEKVDETKEFQFGEGCGITVQWNRIWVQE